MALRISPEPARFARDERSKNSLLSAKYKRDTQYARCFDQSERDEVVSNRYGWDGKPTFESAKCSPVYRSFHCALSSEVDAYMATRTFVSSPQSPRAHPFQVCVRVKCRRPRTAIRLVTS